jgi:hypothetical protein
MRSVTGSLESPAIGRPAAFTMSVLNDRKRYARILATEMRDHCLDPPPALGTMGGVLNRDAQVAHGESLKSFNHQQSAERNPSLDAYLCFKKTWSESFKDYSGR